MERNTQAEKPPPIDPAQGLVVEVGAAAPAVDVSTTGDGAGALSQSTAAAEDEDWTQVPEVQVAGGYWGGLCLGIVPFAGLGEQLLEAGDVIEHGSPEAELGLSVGQLLPPSLIARKSLPS